ncbi:arginine biosynthesis ArgJ [Clavulina sp. PMI_390]|nr:arginine biosynthesis ArgJ [Clavulina sp. PMI_390]
MFVRRLHSSALMRVRSMPPKDHHHQPISDNLFPRGFLATALSAGVKKRKPTSPPDGPKDLALIISTTPRTSSAACFTRNVFKAAPVQVSTQVLKGTSGRANKLVVNSGCANAVTGTQGMKDAWLMAKVTDETSASLSSSAEWAAPSENTSSTLVMSTGVIGQLLPIEKVVSGIKRGVESLPKDASQAGFADWDHVARAFMTTDTFPKLRARTFTLPSLSPKSPPTTYRIAGIDKGAGMIHPNMGPPHATLLGVFATDAPVSPRSLQNALTYAVDRSFNSISVEGDMSTNDTIVVLANGAGASEGAAAEELDEEKHPEAFEIFKQELTAFAIDLAKLVVYDGEGATKFITVTVKNAPSYEHAHHVASVISRSPLTKTALYGEDANWGRILCAVGYSPLSASTLTSLPPLEIDPTRVSVTFIPADGTTPLPVLVKGEPEIVDEARASEVVGQNEINIEVDLGIGQESATYWTCDLSHEYVSINGDYRS